MCRIFAIFVATDEWMHIFANLVTTILVTAILLVTAIFVTTIFVKVDIYSGVATTVATASGTFSLSSAE